VTKHAFLLLYEIFMLYKTAYFLNNSEEIQMLTYEDLKDFQDDRGGTPTPPEHKKAEALNRRINGSGNTGFQGKVVDGIIIMPSTLTILSSNIKNLKEALRCFPEYDLETQIDNPEAVKVKGNLDRLKKDEVIVACTLDMRTHNPKFVSLWLKSDLVALQFNEQARPLLDDSKPFSLERDTNHAIIEAPKCKTTGNKDQFYIIFSRATGEAAEKMKQRGYLLTERPRIKDIPMPSGKRMAANLLCALGCDL